MTETGESLEVRTAPTPGGELDNHRLGGGLAAGNGVIDPARWQMLAAIAETVSATEFVPVGLRNSDKKTLACLLYGDALGLQPMTSLKEIHVIDGVPGLSAAAMTALVRKAHPGHRLGREEIRDPETGAFLGTKAIGTRGDTGEHDEYTFTLQMGARAGLLSKNNWKNYPEAMCWARAASQLCTFLFPDVFMGSPYMPEELEGLEPAGGVEPENGHVVIKPPAAEDEEETVTDEPEQQTWSVVDVDGNTVATIGADDYKLVKGADTPYVRFDGADYEIVGYQVDGETQVETINVRLHKAAPAAKPAPAAEGTPAAVVKENLPKVFEYVNAARDRGDVEFIRGVLDAEKADKNRGRLVGTLEEILAQLEVAAVQQAAEQNPLDEEPLEGEVELGSGGGADLGEEPESAEDGVFEPAPAPQVEADAALLAEIDPEIPYTSATRRAKLVRLAALCAYMEDQRPNDTAWHLAGVIKAASHQWGVNATSLDDLADDQLEKIWRAAETHAADGVRFLALVAPADTVKMAGR